MALSNEFPTYGGLARQAMVAGLPLMPTAMVMGASTIIAMILMIIIGGKGLLVLLLVVPILLAFKSLSANDDQALAMIGLELQLLFKKRNGACFNNNFSILGAKLGRTRHDYQRFFKTDVSAFKPTARSR